MTTACRMPSCPTSGVVNHDSVRCFVSAGCGSGSGFCDASGGPFSHDASQGRSGRSMRRASSCKWLNCSGIRVPARVGTGLGGIEDSVGGSGAGAEHDYALAPPDSGIADENRADGCRSLGVIETNRKTPRKILGTRYGLLRTRSARRSNMRSENGAASTRCGGGPGGIRITSECACGLPSPLGRQGTTHFGLERVRRAALKFRTKNARSGPRRLSVRLSIFELSRVE